MTDSSQQISDERSKNHVVYIDAVEYTVPREHATIEQLLAVANISSTETRLIELRGEEQIVHTGLHYSVDLREPRRFEQVHVEMYTVDDELFVSVPTSLTVREILKNAGLSPEDHYLVELRGTQQIDHKNLDEVLHLRECEKFMSMHSGPTPVS